MEQQSPKFRLNKQDGQKLLKGFLVACGGAALTYFSMIVTQIDFGVWTPVVVALASSLVNIGRKLLAGQPL